MKKLLLFTPVICVLFFSCEDKKDTSPKPSPPILEGKWEPTSARDQSYDSLNQPTIQGSGAWNNHIVEFTAQSIINEYYFDTLDVSGTYVLKGNKLEITFQPRQPYPDRVFFKTNFIGYIDSLTTNKLIVRDTTYFHGGDYRVRLRNFRRH